MISETANVDTSTKSLQQVVAELNEQTDRVWAWENFMPTVLDLIRVSGAKDVLEIGGGRSPSFTQEQVETMGLAYTSNDISARELSKAPGWVGKAHFDIQTADRGTVDPFAESFDFAFSTMVMEHVASYRRAYQNIHAILRPGGVAIAFHPVLYAFPFVINLMMPEKVSQALLERVFPSRNDDGIPKFPARYSGCSISLRVRETIREFGFRDVWQVPFYGHDYYSKFPVIRNVHDVVTKALVRAKAAQLASYAYTIVRK